ncbi:MAG: hypothetical protein EAZ24_02180 [Burkholderiales bacterium]|nr:MAG: hypothetical protein EAZ21_03080 [Betaproteobacteria bacterium]TAG84035.1 MAG: hypothetical protein EAZ24_02180 [Burkholderiales bacterium]
MLIFLVNVLRGTPIWVWAILAALVSVGLRQLRARSIRPWMVFVAPVIFLAIGVLSSGRHGAVFAAWTVAAIVAAFIAAARPRGGNIRYEAKSGLIHIPGSAMPLFFMMTIFLINYVTQVMFAIDPTKATSIVWQVGSAIIMGTLTGVFFGRSIAIFRLSRDHSSTRVSSGSTRSIQ